MIPKNANKMLNWQVFELKNECLWGIILSGLTFPV